MKTETIQKLLGEKPYSFRRTGRTGLFCWIEQDTYSLYYHDTPIRSGIEMPLEDIQHLVGLMNSAAQTALVDGYSLAYREFTPVDADVKGE